MKKMNRLLSFMVLGLAMTMTACDQPVPSSGQTVSFVVTFNTNEGSTVTEVTVNENGVVGTVEAPTKEGHNFAGWYLNSAFTQEVDLSTYVPTADITVYAKWTVESFDIKFEENGGSDVQDITVDYGTPITLPEPPTKEGYDFVKWYLDEELLRPYANQVIKEDTTLYAKWRSGLVYIGSETGEAVYNEDGSYTFSVNLPLWGRFQLMYYGTPISANDENLTITGLFNPSNSADWTRNLYCDIPEGGTEVDYTTFLCCKAGIYDVTYDPASNTLDIQDGNPVVPIPETGFCYRYTQGASADLVDPITVELNAETNTYSFEVELAAWRYVEMYYNGVIVDSVDVDKAFNINGGNIYIGDSPDPTTSFYTSVANKYKFEYTPATGDAKAKVTTSLVIEIPETGVYYMYTNSENVLQAPKAATYDEATGTYAFEVELAQWRYFTLYKDGQAVPYTDLTITGDGWVDGSYDNSGNGSLYIDGDPTHFLRSQGDVATYKVVYSATNKTLEVDNLSYEPEKEPTIPETGVYFTYDMVKDGVSVPVIPEASEITEENGAYSFTVGLGQWRWVSVYKDGKPVTVADMNVSGDGWVDGTYDSSTNGSLYIPEDATHLMRSQAGVVDYKLTYNPTDNSLVIDNLSIGGESENYAWALSSDQHAKLTETAGEEVSLNQWRTIIAVDAEGKIAYMGDMPAAGYPVEGHNFVSHSAYADNSANPALVADNGWVIKVPEGGYIVTAYPGEDGSLTARDLVKAITGVDYVQHGVHTNAAAINVDDVRLAYDKDAGTVTVKRIEVSTWALSSDQHAKLTETAGEEVSLNQWRTIIAVDAEGKIAYMGDMPAAGYPVEGHNFVSHSAYADNSANPALVADNGWLIKVPEGGFIITAYPGEDGSLTARDLVKAITGADYVQHGVHTNAAAINVDNVRLSHSNGVITITVL